MWLPIIDLQGKLLIPFPVFGMYVLPMVLRARAIFNLKRMHLNKASMVICSPCCLLKIRLWFIKTATYQSEIINLFLPFLLAAHVWGLISNFTSGNPKFLNQQRGIKLRLLGEISEFVYSPHNFIVCTKPVLAGKVSVGQIHLEGVWFGLSCLKESTFTVLGSWRLKTPLAASGLLCNVKQ